MDKLLDEIESYWSTRTEGYSEVNEKELKGTQKKAWLETLEAGFEVSEAGKAEALEVIMTGKSVEKNGITNKVKEQLRILDIGTGPGFFPMILAEAGYHVTAVDYTPGMLEKAAQNASKFIGEKSKNIEFKRMDAQALEFADESFDVIISRNLTWNLPQPEAAYKEWLRVLKKGGKLLNFDANWYGYLYDEEKREAYENDRKNVEKVSLDDHYLCTDIDRMEKIALQVPLSEIKRPEWDRKILEGLGAGKIEINENIWQQVWSEEEKLNYGSTPMFMVEVTK
ncbi:class I SAM-dependent methyltransferase [Blautia sp. HCP3S3_H10_1]|uniref:class I SAM-dependent methyltransferase n=1 Tax=unclassified Blautia TaxID=2648079 RepID=UPI003F908289|nr:class I SAM-dependent methyltransferase [Clostridia bacterium]